MQEVFGQLAILGVLVASGVAFLLRWGAAKKNEGHEEAETDAMQDAYDRMAEGRERLADRRDGDPDERVRDNDGYW